MKSRDLRLLSDEELAAKVEETSRELVNVRFQTALAQQPDTSKSRRLRKLIARIKTIQRERQLQAGANATGA